MTAYVLFDDARPGAKGPFRLYRDPVELIRADRPDELLPALERVRAGLKAGRHAAGYLAYEAGYALEPKLAPCFRAPDGPLLWFGLFDGPTWLDDAARQSLLDEAGSAPILDPEPRITKADYVAAAGKVREALHAGDYYQANLTFGCDVRVSGDPLALYAQLNRSAQAPWGGVLVHDEGALVSLSPEQFFSIEGGALHARPMKGTAPRHADPAVDRAAAEALAADEKQRAENLMIVDLLRNDLARVAETGSVAVPQLFHVEHYPTVHQMVSLVTARLRAGLDAVDVLKTIFPCGSVTGAPKIAAMEALRTLEPEPRGAYTGSMGWIEPGGDAAFNVLIRTIQIVSGRSQARLGLGSGLVVDSVPDNEWAECLLKGEFVRREAKAFDLIETMRYDPMEGIVDLEAHLERMKESAADLGFRYSRHDARNELQAATFGKRQMAMVRLLLGPSGAMAIELRPMPEAPAEPVRVAIAPLPVKPGDLRLKNKTSDRDFYDAARRASDAFEVIFETPDGLVTEGSRTNVFVEKDGMLVTPRLETGLLAGVFRAQQIASGKAVEGDVTPADLADGFFIGNSVRGMMAATLA